MDLNDLYFLAGPPLAALALMAIVWTVWGRGPSAKDTVAVQTGPLTDFGVLESGVLYDDIINTRDISLELLNLAYKGIIEIAEDRIFRLKFGPETPQYQALSEGQKILLETLFEDNPEKILTSASPEKLEEAITLYQIRRSVPQTSFTVSSIRKLAANSDEFKNRIYHSLTERGYFNVPPDRQRLPFYSIAGLMFTVPLLVNITSLFEQLDLNSHYKTPLMLPWSLVFGLAIAAITISFIASYIARKTVRGKEAKAYILGFREFIITAEMDRIRFILKNDLNAYRQIIPYAGLFSALDKWLEPLSSLEQKLITADYSKIMNNVSAFELESSFSEKKRWHQALLSLFLFGIKLLPKKHQRRSLWDDSGFGL